MGVSETDPLSQLNLPPGFRFYPTDEELMVKYLCRKVAGQNFPLKVIGDIDLYKFDPWVLPSKAMFGEKEWYFFSPRERKYPNGSRPNRVAGSGYWKATGTDKMITSEGRKVGIKKALVFYIGKAPKGSKTNWIMHEYRLLEPQRKIGSTKLDDWVLCRIYKKNSGAQKDDLLGIAAAKTTECSHGSSSSSSSQLDESLLQPPTMNPLNHKPTYQNLGYSSANNFDWSTLTGLNNPMPEQFAGGGAQLPMQNQELMNTATINTNDYYNLNQNDMYVSSGYGARMIEQEVQSGLTNQQQVDNSGFLNLNSYAQTQGYINSVISYPNQPGNSLFRN